LTRRFTERRRAWCEVALWAVCVLGATPQWLRMRAVDRAEVARFESMLDAGAMRQLRFTATARDEHLPHAARWQDGPQPADVQPILHATPGLRIAIRANQPRAIELDVKAETPAELCLARWSFPFWTVFVDDQAQEPQTCPGGSLGVHIGPGR